jgi:hypothetical protein
MTKNERELFEAEELVKSILAKRGNLSPKLSDIRAAAEKIIRITPEDLKAA